MPKPRLPWKRGPAAWKVKCQADAILQRVATSTQRPLSLRAAARLLGLSTQPLRDWLSYGYLKPTCSGGPFALEELRRLVLWLQKHAQPFDPANYVRRFFGRRVPPPYPFQKLATTQIVWPARRTALTPRELAHLVGCHPSLVVKAITIQAVRGRRPTPCRWEITRPAWSVAFPLSIRSQPRFPPLPLAELISTSETAAHLRACGMPAATPALVRALIRDGKLAASPRTPPARKLFVLKSSLKDFRHFLKKNC
jgi:hypothetical protein